jgi:hypothetical protein
MKLRYLMALMGFAYSAYVAGGTGTTYLASTSPSTQVLERIREEFLDLKRPIKHSLRERRLPGTAAVWHQIVLKGKARSFAQHHSLNDRIYALDDYLNDPEHSLAAFLVLSGSEGMRLLRLSAVEGGKRPSSLTEVTDDDVEYLRWRIARMLNKPVWWRGPDYDPLHDYTSMARDRAHWAEHIETLRAMLRDRALIKKHKLEMVRIFAALHNMEATNAAPEIADYLLMNQYTMEEITPDEFAATNIAIIGISVCPATMTLARLGAGSISPVLDKLVRTAEESGHGSDRFATARD